jgi:uncharacterized protein (DUF362 family)
MDVFVENCSAYDLVRIDEILSRWESIFRERIHPGQMIVLKPNWLSHSHKYDENEWESIITNPAVITAVLKMVLKCLGGAGKVVITDGPQTQSSWKKIMARMTPERWIEMGANSGVEIELLDLRDDEWTTKGDVIVKRDKLAGDPLGSTECDLNRHSEFVTHRAGKRGYFGADYNLAETNRAHSNGNHRYKVSRTVISGDVFVNIPKMKTHKKAGITCSLKNLVGINTYKNWLPHHSEGTPDEGGDQFPRSIVKNKVEGLLFEQFISFLWSNPKLGKWLVPVKGLGKALFGDTREVIRSGNWYGNDTIWRMILDLNKLLLYANPDGTLREDKFENRKSYISVIDGIVSGEGNGPEAPDGKQTGLLIAGTNPVAVDTVCAKLMGFDWQKIPSIKNSFLIGHYPICDFKYEDIVLNSTLPQFNESITNVAEKNVFRFKPHFGWEDHIEMDGPDL